MREAIEPGAGEDGKMRGERVRRHVKRPRDVARRKAGGTLPDEQAKHLEPALLRESAQGVDGV